jgi:hypothetical protein
LEGVPRNSEKRDQRAKYAPRLDKGTLENPNAFHTSELESASGIKTLAHGHAFLDENRPAGPGWRLSMKRFPSGDVECTAIKIAADERLKGGGRRKATEKSDMDADTLAASVRRSRKVMREKIQMIEADRILTLTYRENMGDIEQGWADLKAFIRRMKKRYRRLAYVAVPEYQERGAVHFHLAINGYYHVQTVRKLWRDTVGEGNIDISTNRSKSRNYKNRNLNARRIAHYLAKYMSKTDIVLINRRRYSASQNIPKPESTSGWVAIGLPMIRVMNQIIKLLTRKPVRTYWELNEGRQLIHLST